MNLILTIKIIGTKRRKRRSLVDTVSPLTVIGEISVQKCKAALKGWSHEMKESFGKLNLFFLYKR
jgi:hypothetical protein